jgi:hypothetical protein
MENEIRKHIDKVKNLGRSTNENFTSMSPSPFGGTKNAEYRRSVELFNEIFKEKGAYYALAFLYDSQYDRNDISKMMEISKPLKK